MCPVQITKRLPPGLKGASLLIVSKQVLSLFHQENAGDLLPWATVQRMKDASDLDLSSHILVLTKISTDQVTTSTASVIDGDLLPFKGAAAKDYLCQEPFGKRLPRTTIRKKTDFPRLARRSDGLMGRGPASAGLDVDVTDAQLR